MITGSSRSLLNCRLLTGMKLLYNCCFVWCSKWVCYCYNQNFTLHNIWMMLLQKTWLLARSTPCSWELPIRVFASMQACHVPKTTTAAMHACKYTRYLWAVPRSPWQKGSEGLSVRNDLNGTWTWCMLRGELIPDIVSCLRKNHVVT